jgi:hypothetical protein
LWELAIDLEVTTERIRDWLEQMAVGLAPGRFRFCEKGSLVPTMGKAGLMATCFAMRSAWQSGVWNDWSKERKSACVEFIQSFQREDGFFYDPWLYKNAGIGLETIANMLLGRVSFKVVYQQKKLNMRAETRQCIGDLFNVGVKIVIPAPLEYPDIISIRRYLQSLSWNHPYSTGSHLSHLMCFLAINKESFEHSENYQDMVNEILQLLSQLHNKKTGTWFTGSPSDVFKINGAMQVLSGLQWLEQEYPISKNLVDFALAQPFENDGCGMLNRLFVLQQASKGIANKYRQKDIQQIAYSALDAICKFQNPDGGFSFYKHKSQHSYYGAKVSKGFAVSDLHGTAMMTWAIGVAIDLLGEEAPKGAKEWNFHRA